MNTLSDVNALSHVHEIMAQFRGWKSEVVKEFQHEYLISIYRNSVEIPTMAPKKRAEKMEDGSKKRPAEDAVPELGTRKGPRMAYHLGTTKESEEDPGGGDIYLFARTNPFGGEEARGSLGSSGSAGSVAETEKRPAESVAERLRWKEQKARDATASGSQESPRRSRISRPWKARRCSGTGTQEAQMSKASKERTTSQTKTTGTGSELRKMLRRQEAMLRRQEASRRKNLDQFSKICSLRGGWVRNGRQS